MVAAVLALCCCAAAQISPFGMSKECPQGCRPIDQQTSCGSVAYVRKCFMASNGDVSMTCSDGSEYHLTSDGCTGHSTPPGSDMPWFEARLQTFTTLLGDYLWSINESPGHNTLSWLQVATGLWFGLIGVRLVEVSSGLIAIPLAFLLSLGVAVLSEIRHRPTTNLVVLISVALSPVLTVHRFSRRIVIAITLAAEISMAAAFLVSAFATALASTLGWCVVVALVLLAPTALLAPNAAVIACFCLTCAIMTVNGLWTIVLGHAVTDSSGRFSTDGTFVCCWFAFALPLAAAIQITTNRYIRKRELLAHELAGVVEATPLAANVEETYGTPVVVAYHL